MPTPLKRICPKCGAAGACECSRERGTNWHALSRRIIERDKGRCRLRLPGCTKQATTTDHVLPVSLGGTDEPGNLQAACSSCNTKKGAAVYAIVEQHPVNRPRGRRDVVAMLDAWQEASRQAPPPPSGSSSGPAMG